MLVKWGGLILAFNARQCIGAFDRLANPVGSSQSLDQNKPSKAKKSKTEKYWFSITEERHRKLRKARKILKLSESEEETLFRRVKVHESETDRQADQAAY